MPTQRARLQCPQMRSRILIYGMPTERKQWLRRVPCSIHAERRRRHTLWLRLYQGSTTYVFRRRCHSEMIFFANSAAVLTFTIRMCYNIIGISWIIGVFTRKRLGFMVFFRVKTTLNQRFHSSGRGVGFYALAYDMWCSCQGLDNGFYTHLVYLRSDWSVVTIF